MTGQGAHPYPAVSPCYYPLLAIQSLLLYHDSESYFVSYLVFLVIFVVTFLLLSPMLNK